MGTEQILEDNSHGYTDFHCQTPSVETGIEKPEVVKTDYVIDYTRLNIDQRVLVKSEQDGYDFRYTYGLDKVKVYTTGEGSNWWGQSIKQCVNAAYVHTDRLGSVVNLSDQYGRVTARIDYTDWGEVRKYTDITVDGGFRRLLPEITYATHEYDDVLNQFYAKARMYDADNKRFDAADPVKGLVTQPVSLVQYVYVFDNPISYIDPLGEMPVWMLRALSLLYNNGIASEQQVTLFAFLANGLNVGTAFHEIAQLNLSKYLYQKGYTSVTLEYATGGKEADIATTQYIWEVKPVSKMDTGSYAPDEQLAGYIATSGKKAGFGILRAEIPIIENIYMGITTAPGHPGIEYYYFYRLKCNNQTEPVSSTVVAKEVKRDMLIVAGVTAVAASATLLEDLFTMGAGAADDLPSILGALGIASRFVFA